MEIKYVVNIYYNTCGDSHEIIKIIENIFDPNQEAKFYLYTLRCFSFFLTPVFSIAHTTREPCANPLFTLSSKNEEDGVFYHFVTLDEFERRRFEVITFQFYKKNDFFSSEILF